MSSGNAADIVIVGGGAAGCVVARRLAESTSGSVMLLEAGPDLRADPSVAADLRDGWRLPKPPDWGYEAESSDGSPPQKLRRGRLIGGTSWLTRFAVRGSAADFDAWASRGNPGWGFADVLPTFRRIETDMDYSHESFHGGDGPMPITRYVGLPRAPIHEAAIEALRALGFGEVKDQNAPTAIGFGRMPMSTRDGHRVTTSDAWLAPDEQPGNVVVRPNSHVDRVILESDRVTGVRLADGAEIRSERVVLCAGTYGSATVLLRSGIGPAEHLADIDIDVRVDLPGVGANLADHPGVDLDSGWRGEGVVGPILHTIATFRSSSAPSHAPDLMFWLTDPEPPEPVMSVDPILLKPTARGTVRLRSANPADPPRITLPHPRDEASDVARLIEGYERAIELANRMPISGTRPTDPGTLDARRRAVVENAYSIPHVVGTCRMGPSATDGDVVDANGRVHGVTRLFVADASVIPDAPSGFPHLITIMLAEHLVARWALRGGVDAI